MPPGPENLAKMELPTPSLLEKLPGELRNKIYSYCLDWNDAAGAMTTFIERVKEDVAGRPNDVDLILNDLLIWDGPEMAQLREEALSHREDTLIRLFSEQKTSTPNILLLNKAISAEALGLLQSTPLAIELPGLLQPDWLDLHEFLPFLHRVKKLIIKCPTTAPDWFAFGCDYWHARTAEFLNRFLDDKYQLESLTVVFEGSGEYKFTKITADKLLNIVGAWEYYDSVNLFTTRFRPSTLFMNGQQQTWFNMQKNRMRREADDLCKGWLVEVKNRLARHADATKSLEIAANT